MALDWLPDSYRPDDDDIDDDVAGLMPVTVGSLFPVPTERSGRNKPMLRRTPVPLLPEDSKAQPDPEARRAGRNWDILVKIFNSLLRGGYIFQDDDNREVWKITASELSIDSGLTGWYGDSTGSVSALTGTYSSGSFGTG